MEVRIVYSSSSSAASWFFPCALRKFFLFTRPGRPLPNGDFSEKSICFWLSSRTRKLGTLTTCLWTLKKIKKLEYWFWEQVPKKFRSKNILNGDLFLTWRLRILKIWNKILKFVNQWTVFERDKNSKWRHIRKRNLFTNNTSTT